MLRAIMLTALAAIFAVSPAKAQGLTPTPEIPQSGFQDIAAVFPASQFNLPSPSGAVIVYNPNTCAKIGTACLFFKYHEHGHVALGHAFQQVQPMIRERDADRYAANTAPPQAILAAAQLLYSGFGSPDWWTYGTPRARAHRLCQFAIQSNKWIGPKPCPKP